MSEIGLNKGIEPYKTCRKEKSSHQQADGTVSEKDQQHMKTPKG
jgi:hypothetical protein